MDRLALVAGLKRTLDTIARLGGDPDLHVEIPYNLLHELRSHVFQLCQNHNVPLQSGRRLPFEFDTLTEPQYFARALRFAVVQLRQTGVPEENHPEMLRGALDLVAKGLFSGAPRFHLSSHDAEDRLLTFQELLTQKLTYCFQAGYYPDSIAQYDLLEEHGLIAWGTVPKAWELTSLGRYAQGLAPFSLLLFLLGAQLSLGRERRGGRYLTRKLMGRLLKAGAGQSIDRGEHLPRHLTLFGIVDRSDDGEYFVSQFGYQLLTAAHEREAQIRDLIQLLLESEIHGFTLREPAFGAGEAAVAANATNNQSLAEAAKLAKAGKHLEALRLLYPSIEALLNSLIEEEGLSIKQLPGLHKKFEELIRIGRLPPRLGYWGEIVTSRNKIVHGNIRDGADDLCAPLYHFVAQFLLDLIQETRPVPVANNAGGNRTTPPLQSDRASRGR